MVRIEAASCGLCNEPRFISIKCREEKFWRIDFLGTLALFLAWTIVDKECYIMTVGIVNW